MTKGKILGDIHQIDKDVELCRTTNERISNQAAQLLIENQIPFTRGWIKVPFFLREKYRGAHQIYVIRTTRNRYGQARRTIDQLDTSFRRRLILSNYRSVRTPSSCTVCAISFSNSARNFFSTSRIGHSRYSGSTAACGATSNNFSPVKCSNS